jgi:hypothetical protein
MPIMIRLAAILTGTAMFGVLTVGSAIAEVSNDTVGNALAIHSLPYTHVEWTGSADGPPVSTADYCVATHAVWFKYTPDKAQSLTASTTGTAYDMTLIGVFDGRPQADPFPACDYFQVPFTAQPGHTYYIAVSTDAEWPPPSTRMVFHLVPDPTVTLFRAHLVGGLRPDGEVGVSMTIACSRRVTNLDIEGTYLRQRSSAGFAESWADSVMPSCTPTPTTVTIVVPGPVGAQFVRGRAALSVGQFYGCDRIGSCIQWWGPPKDPVWLWLRPTY